LGVIVYVETNFLMSVAMGRESRGMDLLVQVSGAVRVAIPSSCYMEAFSAFEDEKKRRNWFKSELDKQIGQLQRDTTSPNAKTLLIHLEQSRQANGRLLDDVQARLFQFIDQAAGVLEPIPASAGILKLAVSRTLIADPTDNLILHAILDHAGRAAGDTKALLTDNAKDFSTPEVDNALTGAGITKSFRVASNVLGWLGSLPS
jgi:PIN domain